MIDTNILLLEDEKESENVYRDELIIPHRRQIMSDLPEPLREIRKFNNDDIWESRHVTFLRQGRALADYEEDYEFYGDPLRYYPTYQSLSDAEVRGYFAWRSRLRKGRTDAASLTFIFLYIYELINNIGVAGPREGYEKLLELKRNYGAAEPKILKFLKPWIRDYIIYYDMPRELLGESEMAASNRAVKVLDEIENRKADEILDAVRQLAPKWLERSRFYSENFEEMNEIIYRVLKRLAAHYAKNCKRNFAEQFFGVLAPHHCHMFSQAVFCDPLKRKNFRYEIDPQYVYQCQNGIWSVLRRQITPFSMRKLDKLIKTIDSIMRQEYGYKHPINAEISTKWIIGAITEEVSGFKAEKDKAGSAKIRIDFKSLAKIRSEARITCEKLIVDEEALTQEEDASSAVPSKNSTETVTAELEEAEERLLRSLLYGGDLDWIKNEGLFVSILTDGVNEKLYDIFGDSVMNEGPEIMDEYVNDLKEMFPA